MRGSPILRALIALGVLLALGWPLHRLLRADVAAAEQAAPVAEVKKPVHVQVSFTQAAKVLQVVSLGQVVWTEENPALSVERDLTVAFPREGIDLEFQLDWPEGTRAAAQVVLTDPEGGEHKSYVWGSGKTVEVLTFP